MVTDSVQRFYTTVTVSTSCSVDSHRLVAWEQQIQWQVTHSLRLYEVAKVSARFGITGASLTTLISMSIFRLELLGRVYQRNGRPFLSAWRNLVNTIKITSRVLAFEKKDLTLSPKLWLWFLPRPVKTGQVPSPAHDIARLVRRGLAEVCTVPVPLVYGINWCRLVRYL